MIERRPQAQRERRFTKRRRAVELLPVSKDSINGALVAGISLLPTPGRGKKIGDRPVASGHAAAGRGQLRAASLASVLGSVAGATRAERLSPPRRPPPESVEPSRIQGQRPSCQRTELRAASLIKPIAASLSNPAVHEFATMTQAELTLPRRSFGQTMRADVWWAQPLDRFSGSGRRSSFIRPGRRFRDGIIISAPASRHFTRRKFWRFAAQLVRARNHFGGPPGSSFSGASSSSGRRAVFRLTCYYYRGAYYKAFWADPPACTVGEPRSTYLGERSFRSSCRTCIATSLYLALLFILVLAHDVWKAMWFTDPATGQRSRSDRRRHAGAGGECCSASRLHFWLSLAATSRRWISRISSRNHPLVIAAYACVGLLQPPAHALGLDEFVLGSVLRHFTCGRARSGALARPGDSSKRRSRPTTKLSPTTSSSSARAALGCARRSKPRRRA